MKYYLLQNIFGALRNLIDMAIIILEGKYEGEMIDFSNGGKLIKERAFDMIRCILDCLVALYYLKGTFGAKTAGVIGVITSIMGILQSLKIM